MPRSRIFFTVREMQKNLFMIILFLLLSVIVKAAEHYTNKDLQIVHRLDCN